MTLYEFDVHSVADVSPCAAVKEPAGHNLQFVCPEEDENLPAGQSVQALDSLTAAKLPSLQSTQTVARVLLYLPAAHGSHAVD